MDALVKFLRENGFNLDPVLDGTFHRFDRTRPLSGWFIGKAYTLNGKAISLARFGDWATDERHEWKSDAELNSAERAEVDQQLMEAATREREAREKLHVEVAARCEEKWKGFGDRGRSPYFERKGLASKLFGCKLYPVSDDVLTVVPARDIEGKLWGLQYISSQGKKNFTSGMRIRGCFHLIGTDSPLNSDTIYICEGVATGASIFEALNSDTCDPLVACAFNAGNLEHVARAIREKSPDIRIVICGDDDRFTEKQGKPWNPGREKAELAGRVSGASVVFPRFQSLDGRPTDFNDLHAREGLAEVQSQLAGAQAVVTLDDGDEGLQPVVWGTTRKGTPIPPSDKQIADALLEHYEDRMVKQDERLFSYTGTHWRMLETADLHRIYNEIQLLYSGQASSAKLKAIYELFLFQTPSAPVDMFQPRPTMANFLNGTLHAVRGSDYKYALTFRAHAREDYLTSVIPLEYSPGEKAVNHEFLSMLARVFEGDPDGEQKIRAVRQMYGACLMPLYPHLFLLHGPQGSGKSSLILPAQRLVHRDNWCSVEPHEFNGFLMESMVGKLVNIVTDIRINQPIDDANLKKIEDRVPVRIDRKYERPIYAPFPATHIFGANGIPPTLDGSSGAHTRRWTFIEVSKYRATDGAYRKDYANWMFEQSPQGVLNFALEGLQDILELEGHFTNPESGREQLRKWQMEHDPVALFIEAIKNNELDQNTKLHTHPEAKIERPVLWENFTAWVQKCEIRYRNLGRNRFFHEVERKGYAVVAVNGVRYFRGIGVGLGPASQF